MGSREDFEIKQAYFDEKDRKAKNAQNSPTQPLKEDVPSLPPSRSEPQRTLFTEKKQLCVQLPDKRKVWVSVNHRYPIQYAYFYAGSYHYGDPKNTFIDYLHELGHLPYSSTDHKYYLKTSGPHLSKLTSKDMIYVLLDRQIQLNVKFKNRTYSHAFLLTNSIDLLLQQLYEQKILKELKDGWFSSSKRKYGFMVGKYAHPARLKLYYAYHWSKGTSFKIVTIRNTAKYSKSNDKGLYPEDTGVVVEFVK